MTQANRMTKAERGDRDLHRGDLGMQPHWNDFVDGVTKSGATGIDYELTISETKATPKRAPNGTGKRRGRPPAAATVTGSTESAGDAP